VSAIFHQLRPNYAADVLDDEIWKVARWAELKAGSAPSIKYFCPASASNYQPTEAPQRITEFLKGFACTEAELAEASPFRPPENWQADAQLFIASLYQPGEMVNIVTDFIAKAGKTSPKGYGKTQTREAWLCAESWDQGQRSGSGIQLPVKGRDCR